MAHIPRICKNGNYNFYHSLHIQQVGNKAVSLLHVGVSQLAGLGQGQHVTDFSSALLCQTSFSSKVGVKFAIRQKSLHTCPPSLRAAVQLGKGKSCTDPGGEGPVVCTRCWRLGWGPANPRPWTGMRSPGLTAQWRQSTSPSASAASQWWWLQLDKGRAAHTQRNSLENYFI